MGKHKIGTLSRKISRKGKLTYIALIFIFFLSTFIRYYGFSQPHTFTFDEGLYSELFGDNLRKDLTHYSTQEAYNRYKGTRKLPEYLDRPLFKHPPLFSYLVALSYSLSGSSLRSAVSVSVLMGSLMVVAVFFLGKVLYDYRVGLLSSLFLCLDPIHWLCSEKIWMETTMSFFMLLAILFFVLGRKRKSFLVLSGISVGLAMLNKYSGILPLFIIISFVILLERHFLKKKEFWLLCILPFLMFSPWVIWNYRVYGNFNAAFVKPHGQLAPFINLSLEHRTIILVFLFVGALVFIIGRRLNIVTRLRQKSEITLKQKRLLGIIVVSTIFGLLVISPSFRKIMKDILVWKHTFVVGWKNPFIREPWYFYLKRLPELSPLYLFSFFSLFLLFLKDKRDLLLVWCSAWILGFFILWRNYQCRYVLPAVPFLIILSARLQVWVYDKLSLRGARPNGIKLSAYSGSHTLLIWKLIFLGIVLYFIAKTLKADMLLAVPHNFAYF